MSLSDKRDTWNDGIQAGAVYEEKDVKEAVKTLKDKLWAEDFENIINEIFGEKLI